MFEHWLIGGLLAAAVAIAAPCSSSQAQDAPRKADIIKLLGKRVKAMRIGPAPVAAPARDAGTISDPEAAEALRQLLPTLPSASFKLDFEYGSSTIKRESQATLAQLGEALSDSNLRSFRYVIAGHTDAAEGRAADAALSERRAAAVRDYLIANFAIPPERLIVVGFGGSRPQEPSNPLSPVNRRVEVINIGE